MSDKKVRLANFINEVNEKVRLGCQVKCVTFLLQDSTDTDIFYRMSMSLVNDSQYISSVLCFISVFPRVDFDSIEVEWGCE